MSASVFVPLFLDVIAELLKQQFITPELREKLTKLKTACEDEIARISAAEAIADKAEREALALGLKNERH